METINFKTKFDIGDNVYCLDSNNDVVGGIILSIIFSDTPFQYEVKTLETGYASDLYRREENEVFDDVQAAIDFGVDKYRKKQEIRLKK